MKRLPLVNDLSIAVFNGVYEPSNDTWLLAKLLDPSLLNDSTIIDTCTGSGVLGIYAHVIGRSRRVILIDLSENAVENAKYNVDSLKLYSALVLQCNAAECIKPSSIDVVISNPPYLPYDGFPPDESVIGGIDGCEVILSIISDARRVLRNGGLIYIVFSSLSNPEKVFSELLAKGFKVLRIEKESFFYEELIAVEAVKES